MTKLDALLAEQGVDRALLFCEYSPRATGIQPIEDLLPIVEHNPVRFRLVANVNPHLHHPLESEVERHLDLGAVAVKLYPVHNCFSPGDREVYAVYRVCEERGMPVIFHSGMSSFPGSRSSWGDPALLVDMFEDFPSVQFVFHGGRGWGRSCWPKCSAETPRRCSRAWTPRPPPTPGWRPRSWGGW